MHPSRFGPYSVVRFLGRGGMGAVYEATDPSTGQTVAIKTLQHHLADDETVRRRFQSEIDTLMNLRHPGIARMLGFGDQDGVPFFAMEFVGGRTLEELLRSGRRFSWRETAAVTVEILRALKSAHDHGVVHRDLKPGNLMFPPAPRGFHVKLTDFGIAKLFGETGNTRSGIVVGTPEYMSPEQAADLPVDQRADLYCLGLVMVAMMTGGPPFRGPLREVLECQRSRRPPRIATLVPDVPPALDELIDRLLDKQAAKRPANAAVVTHALVEILGNNAPAAARKTTPDQTAPTVAMQAAAEGPRPAREGGRPPGPHDTTVAIDLTAPAGDPATLSGARPGQSEAGSSTFTTVEDLARSTRAREARAHRLQIIGGSLVALATMAGVTFVAWGFLKPIIWPSADARYELIKAVYGEPDDLRDPCPLIKEFLEEHPADERVEGVRSIGREIALERLRKRSRRRLPGYAPKSDAERLYLEAIRAAAENPAAAAEKFRKLIESTAAAGAAGPTTDDPCAAVERPDDSMWCELARRQFELVEPLVMLQDAEQRAEKEMEAARAAAMLRQAAGYQREAETTTDAARRVIAITLRHQLLEELVDVYADKPHAAKAVAEARRLLAAQ